MSYTQYSDALDREGTLWRPVDGQHPAKLIGEVVDIDRRESQYGEPYPVVTIKDEEGECWTAHLFHTVARREFDKAALMVGDTAGIKYRGQAEPTEAGRSGAHLYTIRVFERVGEPPTAAPGAGSLPSPPPVAATAADEAQTSLDPDW